MTTKAVGVSEDEYGKIRRYLLAKAARYGILVVQVSDIMLTGFSEEQIVRLKNSLTIAGHVLKIKHHLFGVLLTADAQIMRQEGELEFGTPGRTEAANVRRRRHEREKRKKQ